MARFGSFRKPLVFAKKNERLKLKKFKAIRHQADALRDSARREGGQLRLQLGEEKLPFLDIVEGDLLEAEKKYFTAKKLREKIEKIRGLAAGKAARISFGGPRLWKRLLKRKKKS